MRIHLLVSITSIFFSDMTSSTEILTDDTQMLCGMNASKSSVELGLEGAMAKLSGTDSTSADSNRKEPPSMKTMKDLHLIYYKITLLSDGESCKASHRLSVTLVMIPWHIGMKKNILKLQYVVSWQDSMPS
jgi:hypothetical protein